MNRRPTTQDITWLLDLSRVGRLDLDPPYQRRSVWTRKDKQFFLDTIFRNYPSPAIFLHKTVDENGNPTYHVVDGKQRLQTVLDFVDGKVRIADDFGDVRLSGKKWEDIQDDQELKLRLWNYQVSVEFLDVVDETLVNTVFDRLNRNSRKLTPQELRHAKYDGWFITVAEAEAKLEEWKILGIATSARSTRMADTQFISELMLVILEHKILGFDQEALNASYAIYDDPDNPETPVEGFTEDEFFQELSRVKRFLLDMIDANPSVAEHIRQYYAFYTLWSLIALYQNELGRPVDLAPKYVDFMKRVQQFAQGGVPATVDEPTRNAFSYFTNTRGANTDLPARQARLSALKKELLG